MISEFFRTLFLIPSIEPADWEQLRLALLRRSLGLLLPVMLVYSLATAALGHAFVPSLAGAGFTAMVLLMLSQRPDARRVLAWGLTVAAVFLMAMADTLSPSPPPSPTLIILMVLPSLGLMLDGAWMAAFYGAAAAVMLGLDIAALPPGDVAGATALGLCAGTGIGLMVSALGWYRGMRRGRAAVEQARSQLLQQRDERQVLALALFHELIQAQKQLQASMGDSGPLAWDRALESARVMQGRAVEIQGLRNRLEDPALDAPAEADFGRGLLLAMLWSGMAFSLLGFLTWLVTRDGAAWHGPFSMAVLGLGLWRLRGGRAVPAWLAWALVATGPIVMAGDTLMQWGQGLRPTSQFWSLSLLNAGLLLGRRVGLSVAGLGIAFYSAALAAGPGGAQQWQQGLGLFFAFMLVLLVFLQAVVWQSSLLRVVDESRRQLAQSLAQRRRLLGTLFHDVANPLTALLALCEQGRAGMAQTGDEARARRLNQRLHELLADSQSWLLSDGGQDAKDLRAVELEPLMAGMADLYQERLAAKRLGLSLEVEAGIKARAQAAVLRDSVLSNLMSNAIKFSRAGSSLELEALELNGQACIELRDRGPGLDPALRAVLESGADLPSTRGSGGEPGQGLGLALAREHLHRMGGRLELLDREGGGLTARICLERA